MTLVIDASVVIKWYVTENDSAIAETLLDTEETFLVPDLLFAECASILTKIVRQKALTPERALVIIEAIKDGPFMIIPNSRIAADALRVAMSNSAGVSAYDASYVALADLFNTSFITADEKLVRKLAGTPSASKVRLLGDYTN